MTTCLPLMKRVLTLLTKNVLIPLRLSAGTSAADTAIQKKIYGSGRSSDLALHTTALIISNEEMEDIMKIVKQLEESGLLMIGISETNKNEATEQKGGVLSILLEALATSILANTLTGKRIIGAGEGTLRAGQDF